MPLTRKRIRITSGAGFFGSCLCERLPQEDNDILRVDNHFIDDKDDIAHPLGNQNLEACCHDVTLTLFVEVDEIYSLADPLPVRPGADHENQRLRREIKFACIFNIYGPCMHPNDGRMVSNFIASALWSAGMD